MTGCDILSRLLYTCTVVSRIRLITIAENSLSRRVLRGTTPSDPLGYGPQDDRVQTGIHRCRGWKTRAAHGFRASMVQAWREGHDLSFVRLPDHWRESEARVGENWVLYWENGILVQGPRQFAPRQVLQSALGGPVPASVPHTGCPRGRPAAENPRILAHTATETALTSELKGAALTNHLCKGGQDIIAV